MKKEIVWLGVLIVYVVIVYFFTVWNRDPHATSTMKLDLFWGYNNPNDDILKDNILNIVSFVPIGILTALIVRKYRVVKAVAIGLLFSLTIEFSQLIFEKGTFDVDDLFNNAVGALIGGLFAWGAIRVMEKRRARV